MREYVHGSLQSKALKILSAEQTRQADAFTISHEPISSLDLMERSAHAALVVIEQYLKLADPVTIVCGTGNNGGDGLALARMLYEKGYSVKAFLIKFTEKCSADCTANAERLRSLNASCLIEVINEYEMEKWQGGVLIDALFGTGISRKAEGLAAKAIQQINKSGAFVISVDLPSGLMADELTPENYDVVKADMTIALQSPKFRFLFPESEPYVGKWHLVDIGLDKNFIDGLATKRYFVTHEQVKALLVPRKIFSHKGSYGYALLVAGSKGMMGAAVLASKACLHSGAGLLTAHVPQSGLHIMQTAVPEALVKTDSESDVVSSLASIEIEKTTAVALGPGLGLSAHTHNVVKQALTIEKPLLLDADALNILSLNKDWLNKLPPNTILTPHQKEFDRLAGVSANAFERHKKQLAFAADHKVIVVLKGAFTCTAMPDGSCYFNSTGNPAMATAGSGDVLTGTILGLLAQQYSPDKAAVLGVYLHGLAGDIAATEKGPVGILASDFAEFLPHAFKKLL